MKITKNNNYKICISHYRTTIFSYACGAKVYIVATSLEGHQARQAPIEELCPECQEWFKNVYLK